jgi:hypothetical protein
MSGGRKLAKQAFGRPLDGGVRRRLLHQACALLKRQNSASLRWRSTRATNTAAGMGRRPMPALAKNEWITGAAYSQGPAREHLRCQAAHAVRAFAGQPRLHTASCTLLPCKPAQRCAFAWHLRDGAPPANGRAARRCARMCLCTNNERCADCRRTGGPARRRRKQRRANHESYADSAVVTNAGPRYWRRLTFDMSGVP